MFEINPCEWTVQGPGEVGCSVVEVIGLWVFVNHLMWALGTELGSSRSAASILNCWATSLVHFYSLSRQEETLSESHTEKTEASPLSVLGLPFTICTAVCNQHWTRVIWGFEIDTKNECPLVAVPASTKPLTNTLARCKMTFKICFLRKEKSHSRLTAKNLQLKLP